MTVKSLTEAAKGCIAYEFLYDKQSITQLADRYQRSRRTIIRVLQEQHIPTGVKPRKKRVPTPLPKLIPTYTPWWRRILNRVGLKSSQEQVNL